MTFDHSSSAAFWQTEQGPALVTRPPLSYSLRPDTSGVTTRRGRLRFLSGDVYRWGEGVGQDLSKPVQFRTPTRKRIPCDLIPLPWVKHAAWSSTRRNRSLVVHRPPSSGGGGSARGVAGDAPCYIVVDTNICLHQIDALGWAMPLAHTLGSRLFSAYSGSGLGTGKIMEIPNPFLLRRIFI